MPGGYEGLDKNQMPNTAKLRLRHDCAPYLAEDGSFTEDVTDASTGKEWDWILRIPRKDQTATSFKDYFPEDKLTLGTTMVSQTTAAALEII